MYSLYADILLMLGILLLMVLFSTASYYMISVCCPEHINEPQEPLKFGGQDDVRVYPHDGLLNNGRGHERCNGGTNVVEMNSNSKHNHVNVTRIIKNDGDDDEDDDEDDEDEEEAEEEEEEELDLMETSL